MCVSTLRLWVAIALMTVSEICWSQQYSIHQFGVAEGLPNSTITGFAEDKLGYLWIGTGGGGIARFDGREFITLNENDGLAYNTVTCMLQDASGMLWIGTGRGLSRFDGRTFKNFLIKTPYPLREAYISSLAVINDTVYFTSRGQLGKIYNDSVYYKPESSHTVAGVFEVGTNELFVLHTTRELIRYGNLRTIRYTLPELPATRIGLIRIDNRIILSGFAELYELHDDSSRSIASSAPGVIEAYNSKTSETWISRSDGLHISKSTPPFNSQESIPEIRGVQSAYTDSEGNNWFGCYGNGLFNVRRNDFVKVIDHDFIRSIYRDKRGTLWVGILGKGLKRIDSLKTNTLTFSSVEQATVRDILENEKGDILAATLGGLITINPHTNQYTLLDREKGLVSDSIYCLEYDAAGNLWVGTFGKGLMRLGKNGYRLYTSKDGLHNEYIFALRAMNQKLYIGTSRGLNVMDGDIMRQIPIPGAHHRMIYSLEPWDDNHLLIGLLGRGVAIMNVHTLEFQFITVKQGLVSDNIHFIAASPPFLWIGTDRGINRVKLDEHRQATEVRLFNRKNGFKGVETNVNSCWVEGTSFYAGSNDGLYRFTGPDPLPLATFPLHLTGIKLFRENELYANSRASELFSLSKYVTLQHDQNHLTFHFNRVNKFHTESTMYRYKLEPIEQAWSPATKINEVTYSNLQGGDYTFLLEATDGNGQWGSDRLVYSFTILHPFYKRPLFILTTAVTGVLLVLILIHFQIRRRIRKAIFIENIKREEQEKLRKEIARDFHDEMGNHLAKIINYIGMLRLKGGLPEVDVYTRIEQSAKHLNNGTKDFIWTIDPHNNELVNLFLYVKDFGERLFQESGITFRAYNSIEDEVRLPFGVARELIMVLKEAMTNAYKHSKAKNISLSLQYKDELFEFSLTDDGEGFKPGTSSGNGLSNMRSRTNKIQAQLIMESKPGETNISVRFSL